MDKVVRPEIISKRFSFGISVLLAYLNYNKTRQYSDLKIINDGFARELLNILYGFNLYCPNQKSAPYYDLISQSNKVIVKVLVQLTEHSVRQALERIDKRAECIANDIAELLGKIESARNGIISANRRILSLQRTSMAIFEVKEKNKMSLLDRQIEDEKTKIFEYEQVVNTCEEALGKIENISGYNIIIFALGSEKQDNSEYRNFAITREELHFNPDTSIYTLEKIRIAIDSILKDDPVRANKLCEFMDLYSNIFISMYGEGNNKPSANDTVDEYVKNFCSPLFLHTYNKPESNRVTLKNLFVEPSMSYLTINSNGPKNCDEEDSIVAIFSHFLWESEDKRMLFIDGDAAIGKTSLISWLCYHYKENDEIGKAIFLNAKLVCIRLRDVSISGVYYGNSILSYLGFKDIESFEKEFENAVIVLEGVDELGIINKTEALNVELFISEVRHAFSSHKIIVTSRPKYVNIDELSKRIQPYSYLHYSLNHYSAQKRKEWIYNYESKDGCSQKISQNTRRYILELNEEEASGVADTPLALYLLVSCDVTDELKNNKWVLYHAIFYEAIRYLPYNDSFKTKVEASSHRVFLDSKFAGKLYTNVGNIAYKMFSNIPQKRYYLKDQELGEVLSYTKDDDEREAIKKCCVLCSYWKKDTENGALEFYHNNIRDFFMCEYIYRRFSEIKIFDDFENSIQNFIELACEVFQYGFITKTTWEQTFVFLYYRMQSDRCAYYHKDQKENKQIGLKMFERVLSESLKSPIICKYNYTVSNYKAMKTVLHNYLVFLRIWFSPITPDVLSYKDPDAIWVENEMLKDWNTILTSSIRISDGTQISFASGVRFQNANFNERKLVEGCFERSEFVDSEFLSANLSKSNFSNTKLDSIDFSDSDLSYSFFDGATITKANLTKARLIGTSFKNAYISNTVFDEIDMSGACFHNTTLRECTWKNIDLKSLLFSNTTFESCTFDDESMFRDIPDIIILD